MNEVTPKKCSKNMSIIEFPKNCVPRYDYLNSKNEIYDKISRFYLFFIYISNFTLLASMLYKKSKVILDVG